MNEYTEQQEKFLSALEAGKYKQAVGTLREGEGFCCLGVAVMEANANDSCLLADCGYEPDKSCYDNLPEHMVELYHFHGDDGDALSGGEDCLAHLNDNGKTHQEIAAIIRAEPWNYFNNFTQPEGKNND